MVRTGESATFLERHLRRKPARVRLAGTPETRPAELASVSSRTLYVVSANHFVNDSSTYLIASLFPVVVAAFHFSEFQIGVLVALGYLTNMIFQPLTGRLSEKYEERKLLMLGISSMAASMLLFTASSTFPAMVVSVLVLRFGSSFYHPVGVSAISRTYSGARLDRSMGFQSSFGNLGVMFAFVLIAPLYLALGWSGPFLIYAVLQFGVVILTSAAMPRRDGTSAARLPVPPSGGTAREREGTESAAICPPRSPSKLNFVGLPLFFFFAALVTGGAYSVVSNFGNLFLVENGFGFTSSDFLVAVWVACAFVGAMETGWLTGKFGRGRLLLITYLFAGLATLLFAFSSGNLALVVLSLGMSGFMGSVTYPAIYSELSAYLERNPALSRGTAYGVLFSGQIAGSAAFGLLAGYLAGAYGLTVPFVIGGATMVFYAAFVYLWTRRA